MEIRRKPEDPRARIAELEEAVADYRRMWIEALDKRGSQTLYCAICVAAFPDRNARAAATIVFGHAVCTHHIEDVHVGGSFTESVTEAQLSARAMVARGLDPFA